MRSNIGTKKSVASFFTFVRASNFSRPKSIEEKHRRILLMIWIAGKFGETPLLADFLISLDENYYSSSAGVDGMKSVFMKCSYLSSGSR